MILNGYQSSISKTGFPGNKPSRERAWGTPMFRARWKPPKVVVSHGISRLKVIGSSFGHGFGDFMGILWWFCGDFVVILWWFYGDFMVILWGFYGDFVGILWWFYGIYPLVNVPTVCELEHGPLSSLLYLLNIWWFSIKLCKHLPEGSWL